MGNLLPVWVKAVVEVMNKGMQSFAAGKIREAVPSGQR